MGKIVRMTSAEVEKEFTPEKIKSMFIGAEYSNDDNPYTSEEWNVKAKHPN